MAYQNVNYDKYFEVGTCTKDTVWYRYQTVSFVLFKYNPNPLS